MYGEKFEPLYLLSVWAHQSFSFSAFIEKYKSIYSKPFVTEVIRAEGLHSKRERTIVNDFRFFTQQR